MRITYRCSPLLAAVLTFCVSADQLDAISVSATKSERAVFDTPDSVTVIDFSELEVEQVQNLGDALKKVPGVNVTGGPRSVAQKPVIRGLGGNRILITVDGARQDFNSGHKGRVFVEPELLKRIEVVKGPGSAVWGSGAMGGVIAMTTKDASDLLTDGESWGVRARTGYHTVDEQYHASGSLFGNLDKDGRLQMLLNGSYRNGSDYKLGGGDTLKDSAEKVYAGLAKLTWMPAAGHEFRLSRQYNDIRGEVPAQADAQTSATAVLTDRETKNTISRLSYTFDPGSWWNPNLVVYDSQQEILEKRIGTDGRLDEIEFDTRGLDARNASVFSFGDEHRHRLTYGIEVYEDKQTAKEGNDAPDLAFPDADADFSGLYLQDEIDLEHSALGNWVLIPGLRYDQYKSETQNSSLNLNEIDEDQLSPKFGAVYKLTPGLNLVFNYGKSFRAPNFQELYISGVHFGTNQFIPNPELKPEHGESLEGGVRLKQRSWFTDGDNMEFSASYYFNRYDDFIETVVTPTVTTFENTEKARIQGVETAFSYRYPAWDADISLSASVSRGDDTSDDEPLDSIPGDVLFLTLGKVFSEWNLGLSIGSEFRRRQDRVPAGQPETPGYSVYSINGVWYPPYGYGSLDDLKFEFGIGNLFDKRYRQHQSTIPEPGRDFKLSVTLQF
jgi:hemoglobin/transferrin/lactoferrin receptor protein